MGSQKEPKDSGSGLGIDPKDSDSGLGIDPKDSGSDIDPKDSESSIGPEKTRLWGFEWAGEHSPEALERMALKNQREWFDQFSKGLVEKHIAAAIEWHNHFNEPLPTESSIADEIKTKILDVENALNAAKKLATGTDYNALKAVDQAIDALMTTVGKFSKTVDFADVTIIKNSSSSSSSSPTDTPDSLSRSQSPPGGPSSKNSSSTTISSNFFAKSSQNKNNSKSDKNNTDENDENNDNNRKKIKNK